jgi:hypothetical protein
MRVLHRTSLCLGVCMARSIARAGGRCHPGDAGARHEALVTTPRAHGTPRPSPPRVSTGRASQQPVGPVLGGGTAGELWVEERQSERLAAMP